MKLIKPSKKTLNEATDILKNGGVIICPTDTVYGFLADASSKKAVDKIFKLKKRPRSKSLPVFVKDIKMAKELAEISKEPASVPPKRDFGEAKQEKMLKTGRITVVLKRKKGIELYGVAKNTIALRIPKHKFLNDLLKKISKPLVQTSVNISGSPALNKIKEILEQFGDKVDLIIDEGNLPKRKPSKIIDLTDEKQKILRK
jgi:L-threonylcarbamoyladenylate synthase